MLVLFVLHHIWNRAWYKSIGRGRPSPYRAVQTALNLLLFAVVLGMLLSGLILSQHILDFLHLQRGETIARTFHLPLSYWGFLLMSLHLGLHWSGIMNTVRRRLHIQSASRNRVLLLRLLAAVLVGYGLYAFAHYRFSDYLLLRTHFIFFAPDQTATRFVVDHLAVMGLFACAAHYGGMGLRRFFRQKEGKMMISKVLTAGALVLALALSGCGEGHTVPSGQEEQGGAAMETEFTVDTPIQTVMDDPVFDDYGRLLFPVDTGLLERRNPGDLRLTYYSHIDPDETVEIVNTLKERALAGETIFYDIYTEEEKGSRSRQGRYRAVLFQGRPLERVLLCVMQAAPLPMWAPCTTVFPHALELSKQGYNAFALIYRPGAQTACEDLARAITFIFDHAEELEVDTSCYSLWGRLGGCTGWRPGLAPMALRRLAGDDLPSLERSSCSTQGWGEYPPATRPPMPVWEIRMGIASWRVMKARLDALSALGIDTEFHVYEGLGPRLRPGNRHFCGGGD